MDKKKYLDKVDKDLARVEEFLGDTSDIESSRGRILNHAIVRDPKSIHFGTRAVGEYGLMPVTAIDIARNAGVTELAGVNKFEAQRILEENPELTRRLAETMASKLLKRNTLEDANIKWQFGADSKVSPEAISQNRNKQERARKFKVLQKKKRDESI